jgi:hypothetical protein
MSVLLDHCSRTNERDPSISLIFPDSLPINNTTLKLATYLEEALGITKYNYLGSGIPNTRFMSGLFDHCARTNERDSSISLIFPESLPINYTTLKLATYLEEALGNKKYHNQCSGNANTGFMSVFLDHCSRTN